MGLNAAAKHDGCLIDGGRLLQTNQPPRSVRGAVRRLASANLLPMAITSSEMSRMSADLRPRYYGAHFSVSSSFVIAAADLVERASKQLLVTRLADTGCYDVGMLAPGPREQPA